MKKSEKFKAGCEALSGKSVSKISKEVGISRQYVYIQKENVEEYLHSLDNECDDKKYIEIDERLYKRAIISLALDCHGSAEGIKRSFKIIFNEDISIGYISEVITEAAKKAQEFDDKINLEKIKQGANDEIFQGNTPILTGIDPESTYVYLLEEAKDRTGETWDIYMEDRKERGLNLEVTINDGGTGLLSGISKAYPKAEFQLDTFHSLRSIGREVSKIERKAYSLIKDEEGLKNKILKKHSKNKTRENLEKIQPKVEESIELYDILFILFGWLKELLNFSGYEKKDTVCLIQFILKEIKNTAKEYPTILKEVEKFEKNLPSLLSYIDRFMEKIHEYSKYNNIPPNILKLMYSQLSYDVKSEEYNHIECELGLMLKNNYTKVREGFSKIKNSVKKASSLVENLNSRIRTYINIKKVVPTKFFVLMKVYFNTKRYRRSRYKSRVGKSPLELLTGKIQPDFFEAIGL